MTHPITIGTVCEVKGPLSGKVVSFVVEGYNEAGYMQMRSQSDKKVTMSLHLEHAKRIAANTNGDSGVKVLNTQNLQDVVVRKTDVMAPVAVVEAVKSVPTASIPVAKNVPSKNGPSKKEQAVAIRAANPTATRKELIAMFMSQLSMTLAGATTYSYYK